MIFQYIFIFNHTRAMITTNKGHVVLDMLISTSKTTVMIVQIDPPERLPDTVKDRERQTQGER